jgi:hypothetical protein
MKTIGLTLMIGCAIASTAAWSREASLQPPPAAPKLVEPKPVEPQLVEPRQAGQPAKPDPYFTPTPAKSTTYMPQVIIRNIREDRAGNIWFATFGGPIRYDGKEFTNFGEEVGLDKRRIFSLTEDRTGALWFGSITGGASRYDGKSFTKFTDKEGLGNNDVLWIFEDRDANIWLDTGNGVSRYERQGDHQLHDQGGARRQLGLRNRPGPFGSNLVWNPGRHLFLRR